MITTWQEWLSACKEAWATEGQGSKASRTAHKYLLRTTKNTRDSLLDIAGKAWRLYKQDNPNAIAGFTSKVL